MSKEVYPCGHQATSSLTRLQCEKLEIKCFMWSHQFSKWGQLKDYEDGGSYQDRACMECGFVDRRVLP